MKRFTCFLLAVLPFSGCGERAAVSPEEADSIAFVEKMIAHEMALKRIQDSLDTIAVPQPTFEWLESNPFIFDDYKDRFRHAPLGRKMEIGRNTCDTAGLVRMTEEDYYMIFREAPAFYNREASHFFYSIEDRPGKKYYSVTVLRYSSRDHAELVLVNISKDGLNVDHVDAASYFYEGQGFESSMSKSVSTISASGRVVLEDNHFTLNYELDWHKDFSAENFPGEITRYRFILEPSADGTFDQVEMHSWKRKVINTDDVDEF